MDELFELVQTAREFGYRRWDEKRFAQLPRVVDEVLHIPKLPGALRVTSYATHENLMHLADQALTHWERGQSCKAMIERMDVVEYFLGLRRIGADRGALRSLDFEQQELLGCRNRALDAAGGNGFASQQWCAD